MSHRRRNSIKRRRRTLRKLALVPRSPQARGEALDAGEDSWPALPIHLPAPARPAALVEALQNKSLVYMFIATLVGMVVLLILRWMESVERGDSLLPTV